MDILYDDLNIIDQEQRIQELYAEIEKIQNRINFYKERRKFIRSLTGIDLDSNLTRLDAAIDVYHKLLRKTIRRKENYVKWYK